MHALGAGVGFVRHFGACYFGMHHNLALFVKVLRTDDFLVKQGPQETLIYPIDSVLRAKRGNTVE
jgi:hypothetical protein